MLCVNMYVVYTSYRHVDIPSTMKKKLKKIWKKIFKKKYTYIQTYRYTKCISTCMYMYTGKYIQSPTKVYMHVYAWTSCFPRREQAHTHTKTHTHTHTHTTHTHTILRRRWRPHQEARFRRRHGTCFESWRPTRRFGTMRITLPFHKRTRTQVMTI